ncbi:hypothetical protein BGZ94_009175 [Podila epigama]|nr:hypothetical protein BGZ94_009175 [Podila epigama]
MRFSVIAIAAAVVAVVSAQDPHPTLYPFKANGACVHKCLTDVGLDMDPKFTNDPTNEYFIKSLGYAHDRGTPKYTAYMTGTGMCIMKCPKVEQDLYNEQYEAKNDFYVKKKAELAAQPTPTPDDKATDKPAGGAGNGASSLAASGLVGAAALLGAVALF